MSGYIYNTALAALGMCAVAGILAPPVAAQDEEAFFEDIPVVVTVTRLPQRNQDLPASVTVIDRRMIEASGAKEIPELFRLVAGFEIAHTNSIVPRASVTYHGMSDEYARRMQVLVDGRSIYTPATGGVDWYGLPLTLEDIERIEVIRGPNGVTYGANSFLGVINIITYHPSEIQGTLVKAVGGDGGYERNVLRHAGNSGALDYRLTVEYQSNDANASYLDELEEAVRDDKSINTIGFRADYRAGVNDYLTLQLGGSDGVVGDGLLDELLQPPHENTTRQDFQQFKWKHVFSLDEDIELQFYHNHSDTEAEYFLPKLSAIFLGGTTPATSAIIDAVFGHPDDDLQILHSHEMDRKNVEFVHRLKPLDSLRVVWGAEVRVDEVVSEGLIGRHSPVTNRLYRLFANGEWQPAERWLVNVGAMAEQNEITGTHLSPRLALNYRLNANHSVRTAYSLSYRTPAILEEYADYGARFYPDGQMVDQIWESDGDLEPEKITSVEVGFVGQTADRRVSYDVRFFREHLRDLIATPIDRNSDEPYNPNYNPAFAAALLGLGVTDACDQLHAGFCAGTVFTNDGSVDMEGVEFQLRNQPTDRTLISVGFSHLYARGDVLNNIRTTGKEYEPVDDAAPVSTLSLLFEQQFGAGWSLSYGHYYVGSMRFLGGDDTGGIQAGDARLARTFRSGALEGTLALTVQDIYGSYFDYVEEIPRTRSAYLSAELKF